MKKTAFALAALSAFAGAAQAQTSVTLYGTVDGSIEYVNRVAAAQPTFSAATGQLVNSSNGGSRVSMPTLGGLSPSRWGIRGTEDLGSGLQAMFVLESGFGLDTGTMQSGRLFGRQAYVGLGSQYGKIMLGRQYTSIFEGFSNFGPQRYGTTYEPVAWQLGLNYREDNTVKYVGDFGPVRAVAHYSFGTGVSALGGAQVATPLVNGGNGETPGNPRDNAGWGAAVTYLGANIGATLVYDEWNPTITTGNPGKVRKFGGAMSYYTGPFKVMAGYRWNRINFANGNTLIRDDYYWAGVNYQATAALGLTLAYYFADIKKVAFTPTATPTSGRNMSQVALLADYNLSKRTDVYVSTAWSHNGGLNFDTAQTAFLYSYPLMAGQKDMFGVTVGVRHSF